MKESRKDIENIKDSRKNGTGTPYDDVFRTLLNDCRNLVIPLINEMFHENFSGDEEIVYYQNEHFLNQQDGEVKKCVTDTGFAVVGKTEKKYHLECQSTSDSSMIVRMFEYGSQIALDDGLIEGNALYVKFPNAAVLFLRSNSNTPDTMQINIETPGGEVSYEIPVLKMKRYTLDEIFEKNLLFLIPFYIFTHESRLQEYDKDKEKRQTLLEEYREIRKRLEQLAKDEVIDEYTKCTIVDMSNKVLQSIAEKYEEVQKGVKKIMGGNVLDYEAKKILNKGIATGIAKGKTEANIESAQRMLLKDMQISLIMEVTNLSEEKIEGLKKEMTEDGRLKEKEK